MSTINVSLKKELKLNMNKLKRLMSPVFLNLCIKAQGYNLRSGKRIKIKE